MKKRAIILVVLGLAFLIILQVKVDNSFSWLPSFREESSEPYGSELVLKWLEKEGRFDGHMTSKPLYKSLKEVDTNEVFVLVTETLQLDTPSFNALDTFVRTGGHIVIVTDGLHDKKYEEWLEFDLGWAYGSGKFIRHSDSTVLSTRTKVRFADGSFSWRNPDTTAAEDSVESYGPWEPLVTTPKQIAAGRIPLGKGDVVLVANPILFTNYGMLYDSLWQATEVVMEAIPQREVVWDEYYKPNAKQKQALMQAMRWNKGLEYGYYGILFTCLLFIVFDGRRRQRQIPVIEPPVNTNMNFVETLAQLYETGNTREKVALRLIDQLKAHVRRTTGHRLGIDTPITNSVLATSLGVQRDVLERALHNTKAIESGHELNADQFDRFYKDIYAILHQGS